MDWWVTTPVVYRWFSATNAMVIVHRTLIVGEFLSFEVGLVISTWTLTIIIIIFISGVSLGFVCAPGICRDRC